MINLPIKFTLPGANAAVVGNAWNSLLNTLIAFNRINSVVEEEEEVKLLSNIIELNLIDIKIIVQVPERGRTGKTNRFVYYRPPWAVSVSIHTKLDLLAVTDTPRNRELSVSTDLCLKKYTQ